MANVRLADYPEAKSDIGLGNVDNTADINKPVSTAQAAADAAVGVAAASDATAKANAAQAAAIADAATDATNKAAAAVAARRTSTALTSTAGVLALNYSLGDYFTLALLENITSITFSNMPGAGKGATIMLRITQNAAAKTLAWPASFKWAGGTPGAVSSVSGAVDMLALTTFDNGTTWQATLAKAFA